MSKSEDFEDLPYEEELRYSEKDLKKIREEERILTINELKQSKYVTIPLEEYTKIIESKSYALGKIAELEKQILQLKHPKMMINMEDIKHNKLF